MAQAKKGDTVKVHYTGKLEDGTVFENSISREPLQFTIGKGQVIPGLEQVVIGMNPGESKTVKVPADKAYGPYRKDKIIVASRNKLPTNLKPELGQRLQSHLPDGQTIVFTLIDISESNVTLDVNHPLAGKDLTFDIQLIEIA